MEKSTAKKRANKAMSDYIRERDKWTCYTCGKVCDKYNADNGHLISRYWSGTLYDEDNCNCQCKGCNILHVNDTEPYKRKFISERGEAAYDELYRKSKLIIKRTVEDYLEIEKHFKDKLGELT